MKDTENQTEYELTTHWAVIELPENTIEVEVKCRVYHNDEIIDVSKKLGMSDVRLAFQKAEDGYIDDDDRFVLTEKGEEFLKEMMRSEQM